MDIPEKTEQNSLKAMSIRHTLVIALMITFFMLVVLFAWVYVPHHNAEFSKSEQLNLPADVAKIAHIDKKPQLSWHGVTVKKGDTLSSIFNQHHIGQSELIDILSVKETQQVLSTLQPDHKINLLLDKQNNLYEMIYQPDLVTKIHFTKQKDMFAAQIKNIPIEHRNTYCHGIIQASLFTAGLRANLPSNLIMDMVELFQWDIDFAKDIRAGDSFDIIYDEEYINGEPLKADHIIAAEFIHRGTHYKAIRYTDPAGHTSYYRPDGSSLKRMFIRTPVKFTRISSYFKPKRWHPILHRFRKHTGVDYAAPAGTPIKATADGKVKFIGRKGGYGNAIILQHGRRYSTLYGHMLRFARHLHKNNRVKQGQVIGYVGMTGLATGYHLHYEFRINNKVRDPLKVKISEGNQIMPKKYRKAFLAKANRLLRRMATYQQIETATHT